MQQALAFHYALTFAEAAYAGLLSEGRTDDEIGVGLTLSQQGVRSRARRLSERTGFHGRRAVAWACCHSDCCIARPATDTISGL